MKILEPHQVRTLLLDLGDHVRQRVINTRREADIGTFAAVSRESVADTIYGAWQPFSRIQRQLDL